MKIILIKDVDNLGYTYDVVDVKNGYGRNYLIPQGFGLLANKSNMSKLQEKRRQKEIKEGKMVDHYKEIATKLEGTVLKIGAKAGSTGKIFGSVTDVQVAEALKNQFEIELERRKISMPDEVKMIGSYKATLNLHKEVTTEIAFEVVEE